MKLDGRTAIGAILVVLAGVAGWSFLSDDADEPAKGQSGDGGTTVIVEPSGRVVTEGSGDGQVAKDQQAGPATGGGTSDSGQSDGADNGSSAQAGNGSSEADDTDQGQSAQGTLTGTAGAGGDADGKR